MLSAAFGRLNIAYDDFWSMTPHEFSCAMFGYNEKEEEDLKTSWEQTRWLGSLIVNVNRPRNKTIQPHSLIRFPWEKADATDDDLQRLRKEMGWQAPQ